MLSDNWLSRYRLLEKFTKCDGNGNGNGNGNAYDRGDYNSSFALRAVELKIIGNFRFKSPKPAIYPANKWHFNIYEQDKFHAQLSCLEHERSYITSGRV